MSTQNHAHQSMLQGLFNIADDLNPLPEKKNPVIAAACGFVFCGLGLGLYLRSWRDFWIPFGLLMLMLILGVVTGEVLMLLAPFVWAAYGYRRVKVSNAKLDEFILAPRTVKAQVIATPPPIPSTQKKVADSRTPLESRLHRLDEMLRKGAISQAERDTKRAQILAEL